MALYNTLTKQDFDEKVLNSDKVVLVDFWAQWCPPCRMMAPILEQTARAMDKTVDIVKIDIEESPDNQQLAQQYGVQGIPNMQIFKNGAVVDELVGMRPAPVLEKELTAAVG